MRMVSGNSERNRIDEFRKPTAKSRKPTAKCAKGFVSFGICFGKQTSGSVGWRKARRRSNGRLRRSAFRSQGSNPLHIKSKVNYISFLHDVVFSLESE